MNEDFEFSASYKVSKTFDDASNYDEQPPNPLDLPAERGLSRQDQWQRFVLNALWDLPFGEDEGQKGAAKSWLVDPRIQPHRGCSHFHGWERSPS